MKPHKQIFDRSTMKLECFRRQIGRHRVIDVQQRGGVVSRDLSHVFTDGPVNIHFTSHRNTAPGQTGVVIAGNKFKRLLKGGPAFVGKDGIIPGAQILFHELHQD